MNRVDLDLTFTSTYCHTPAAVWAALTDREALRSWFLETDFEARVGQEFYVKGPHIGVVKCVVVALDEPHRMEWSWLSPELPTPTTVSFTLEETQGGTRLLVKHVGSAPLVDQRDITRGWPSRLSRLRRWLDGDVIASVAGGESVNSEGHAGHASNAEIVTLNGEARRMTAITVPSTDRVQVIDLTDQVAAQAAMIKDGTCHLFTRHTTCALTVLTDEEGIAEDFLNVLHGLVPQASAYVHDSADHVRAHVLSALVGPSVSVPVQGGRLTLGQFQRIVLLEFEGPRERAIELASSTPSG